MNGPKISPQQYPNSLDAANASHSSNEVTSPSPAIHIVDASLNEVGVEEEDEEDIETGVVVAEMVPDDHFVSVYGKRENYMDSEFGDDHFEATENWSTQVSSCSNFLDFSLK